MLEEAEVRKSTCCARLCTYINYIHHLQATSPAVLGVAKDQQFPLEPNITILSSPPAEEDSSPHKKNTSSKSSAKPKPIPEYSSAEEFKERRSHQIVSVGGEENVISLNMVEPYKKIIQHAGWLLIYTGHAYSAFRVCGVLNGHCSFQGI